VLTAIGLVSGKRCEPVIFDPPQNRHTLTDRDSNQILHSDKNHQILFVGLSKICPTNPKWRTAVILKKKDKLLYLSNGLTDFDEILHMFALGNLRAVQKIIF